MNGEKNCCGNDGPAIDVDKKVAVPDESLVMTEQVDQVVGFDSKAPINHATPFAADVSFRARYEEATRQDRWMAACWCVEGGIVVLNGITTSNFPRGDFKVAIQQLINGLEKLKASESNPPEPEPLPKAEECGECV